MVAAIRYLRMRGRRSELLVSFPPVSYTKVQQGRCCVGSIRTEPPSQQRSVATARMRPVSPDVMTPKRLQSMKLVLWIVCIPAVRLNLKNGKYREIHALVGNRQVERDGNATYCRVLVEVKVALPGRNPSSSRHA